MQDKHIKYKLQRTAKRERRAQHTKGTNTYTHLETGSNLQRSHGTRNYWRARFVDHWKKSSLSELVRSSGPPIHSHRLPLFNHPVKSVILPLTLSQTRMVHISPRGHTDRCNTPHPPSVQKSTPPHSCVYGWPARCPHYFFRFDWNANHS